MNRFFQSELKTLIMSSILSLFVITYMVIYFGYNDFIIDNSKEALGIIGLFCCILIVAYVSYIIYIIYYVVKLKKKRQITIIHPETTRQTNTNDIVIIAN